MWYQRIGPLKPPRIHGNIDREGTDLEKECLQNMVLNHRPQPKPPPEILEYSQTSWTN